MALGNIQDCVPETLPLLMSSSLTTPSLPDHAFCCFKLQLMQLTFCIGWSCTQGSSNLVLKMFEGKILCVCWTYSWSPSSFSPRTIQCNIFYIEFTLCFLSNPQWLKYMGGVCVILCTSCVISFRWHHICGYRYSLWVPKNINI